MVVLLCVLLGYGQEANGSSIGEDIRQYYHICNSGYETLAVEPYDADFSSYGTLVCGPMRILHTRCKSIVNGRSGRQNRPKSCGKHRQRTILTFYMNWMAPGLRRWYRRVLLALWQSWPALILRLFVYMECSPANWHQRARMEQAAFPQVIHDIWTLEPWHSRLYGQIYLLVYTVVVLSIIKIKIGPIYHFGERVVNKKFHLRTTIDQRILT